MKVRQELLPDIESFEIMRKFFEDADNSDYDNFIKRFKCKLVKKLAESGKSLVKNRLLMRMIFR
jgi:hypothetical protein